uniref:Glycine-rich protein n=1 Tax=Plectus sambesii TaxID=2011161 RepID=A0A914V8S1_9BILA
MVKKINSAGEVVEQSSPLDWFWNMIAFIIIFFKSLFSPNSNSRGDRYDTADRRDRFRGDNNRGNGDGGGGGGGGGLGGPQRRIGGLNRGSGVAPPPTGGGCSGGGCGR